MATTVTASAAQANASPPAIHAGLNVQSVSYTGVVSTSGSGVLLLCKVPVNAVVHSVESYHNNVATAYAMKIGYRSGVSTSASFSAFMGSGTKATQRVMQLPAVNLSSNWDQTNGERFKYVTATVKDASDTGSVSFHITVMYTADQSV